MSDVKSLKRKETEASQATSDEAREGGGSPSKRAARAGGDGDGADESRTYTIWVKLAFIMTSDTDVEFPACPNTEDIDELDGALDELGALVGDAFDDDEWKDVIASIQIERCEDDDGSEDEGDGFVNPCDASLHVRVGATRELTEEVRVRKPRAPPAPDQSARRKW